MSDRIFKIGSTTIQDDESTRDLSAEEARRILRLQYPEVAHADINIREEGDLQVVEFAPRAGRKG